MEKILLITNNALMDGDANGRTLGTLLESYPKDCLMQFCTNGHSVSSRYMVDAYKFSDRDVLRTLAKMKCECKKLVVDSNEIRRIGTEVGIKKSSAVVCGREILWRLAIPRLDLYKLAKSFRPDIVLLQLGACAFTAQIAYRLAEKLNIKLIVFTTEDYYFKKWNYIEPDKKNLFYYLFSKYYNKVIKRLFRKADFCICNTPFLANMYQNEFGIKTSVIMNSANGVESSEYVKDNNKIVYAGNLELERYISLIEIAQEIYKISPDYHLDVYGGFSQVITSELSKQPNIRLKGFAAYKDILKEMAGARLVLHMESPKEFYKRDLRAAFSTKIPDSLACTTPLLLYAPEELAETKYLQENECAFVCTGREDLELVVNEALTNAKKREFVLENSRKAVEKNHTHKINQENFIRILKDSCR